ncbi:DUF6381 family protein [Streptomyces sp. NPDC059262]|uniref:DUF6381 family protein n=1 Tax=Streptomyces sp. NPDC059262 TaxID=3346797 RepID=UPI0036990FDF
MPGPRTWKQAAERTTDPAERQRLKGRARRLKEKSERAGGTGKPNDPTVSSRR